MSRVNAAPEREAISARNGIYRTIVIFVLKVVVSAITLLVVFNSISPSDVLYLLSMAQGDWLIFALLVFLSAQIVSSWRFALIARALACPLSFGEAVRLHFIGLWFNQVFPSSLGGDAVKIFLLRRLTSLGLAFVVTMLDRASGLIFLLASIVVLSPLYILTYPAPVAGGLIALSVLGLSAIAVFGAFGSRLVAMTSQIPLVRELFQLFESLWMFRRGRLLVEQCWTSAIVHMNGIISYALIGKALGVSLDPISYILVTPIVFLVALVPISFAGWGVREIGAIWSFGLLGVPADQAAAMSIVFGLMLIVAGLPGIVLILIGRYRGDN